MACMYMQHQKRYLTNGTMSGNPSKKIRLDSNSKGDGSLDKDELWGADDLTAEEFDFLEIQATQTCNPAALHTNYNAFPSTSTSTVINNFNQVDDLKQLQYELEGRVKLLTHSLEKSTKELSEERLNREKLIDDRLKASKLRESEMQKKIENLQSVLEFKEQEMKSIYSKLTVMKAQNSDKKHVSPEKPVNKSFENFFTSCKQSIQAKESCNKFSRRTKLKVDSSRGKSESMDLLSIMLCDRLTVKSPLCSENSTLPSSRAEACSVTSSPLCIVQLKSHQQGSELLEYCKLCLEQHVFHFKSSALNHPLDSSSKPPSSIQMKGDASDVLNVISVLKDTMCILRHQSIVSLLQEQSDNHSNSTIFLQTSVLQKSKDEMFSNCNKSSAATNSEKSGALNLVMEILKLLMSLADPKTFPDGFPKLEIMELALFALFDFSVEFPKIFLKCVPELPVASLLSSEHSFSLVYPTLKILVRLSACRNFSSQLVHSDSGCILCAIALFMCKRLKPSPEACVSSMLLVIDFLSSVLSVHSSGFESASSTLCLSEVIQNTISLLWLYYQMKEKNCHSKLVIKKGLLLLHVMAFYVQGFKERRLPVEDEYISFVSSILTLSKEEPDFKEFYDLVHNLWDFQTDTSEFDLDEGGEEAQSSNEMDDS